MLEKKKAIAEILTSSHDGMRFDEESDGFVGWLIDGKMDGW